MADYNVDLEMESNDQNINLGALDDIPVTIPMTLRTGEGAASWDELAGKPFSTIGSGLEVESGALTVDTDTIATKEEIPTKVSDLDNDSDFQTDSDVAGAISEHNSSPNAHQDIRNSIPTNNNQLENGRGFQTAAEVQETVADAIVNKADKATTLAGYGIGNAYTKTETDSLLGAKANTADLAEVATSGDYEDLENKPTIPTVNNGTLTIKQDGAVIGTFTANQSGDTTVNVVGGGGGGTSNYDDLNNKPKINSVELSGNKSAADLGLATAAQGSKADTAVQPSAISDMATKVWVNAQGFIKSLAGYATEAWVLAKNYITMSDVNTKLEDYTPTANLADVATSGNYNDLTNKPTIPTALSQLSEDATHRIVTDTEKATWNGKSDFSGSYDDLTDKPTIPTQLSQLSGDSTHRVVTDAEKTSWNNKSDFSGSYDDLSDKPTIPTALSQLADDSTHRVVTDSEKSTWNNKQSAITDLETIRSGAAAGATALQPSALTPYRTASAQDVIDGNKVNKTSPLLTDIVTDGDVVNSIVASHSIKFTNVSVATSAFVADTTYEDYGYKADITCNGVTANDFAVVAFSPADAGIFAPVCNTSANVVTIYASEVPESAITILSIAITR